MVGNFLLEKEKRKLVSDTKKSLIGSLGLWGLIQL